MINIYYRHRPDMAGCHVFEDLARAGDWFDDVIIGDRWRPHMEMNICVDTGHQLPPPPETREASFFWCLHCHTAYHQSLARHFERSFGADVKYVRSGHFDEWLPNGVGTSVVYECDVFPQYDVGFVGQFLGQRIHAADALRRICDRNGWTHRLIDSRAGRSGDEGAGMARPSWVTAEEFRREIALSRVWFNATTEPRNELLNNRIFEGMAAGRPCLSDTAGSPNALVADGQGVLYYDWRKPVSMEAPLRRLLDDREFYGRVVAAGLKELPKHTIEARLRTLIDSARRTA